MAASVARKITKRNNQGDIWNAWTMVGDPIGDSDLRDHARSMGIYAAVFVGMALVTLFAHLLGVSR